MELNATIFGQIITFSVLIWFNKKLIWPKVINTLNAREQQIADGLSAAALGQQQLEQANLKSKQQEIDTRKYCNTLINETKKQAEQILELTVIQAKNKGDEIITQAYLQIEKEKIKVQKELQYDLSALIIQSTEKIMQDHLTVEQHQLILNHITQQFYEK